DPNLEALQAKGRQLLHGLDKATADFDLALLLQPDQARLWQARGRRLEEIERWDQATADFAKAGELDPKKPAGWTGAFEANPSAAQWDKAAAHYRKALELRPDNPMLWFENACLELQIGNDEGYRKLCSRMVEKFGQSQNVFDIVMLAHACVLAPHALSDTSR